MSMCVCMFELSLFQKIPPRHCIVHGYEKRWGKISNTDVSEFYVNFNFSHTCWVTAKNIPLNTLFAFKVLKFSDQKNV